MASTGSTPISLYYSATASNVPLAANLVAGELAMNTADGKLFFKDSAGVVQTMASKATGAIGGSTTQVQFNNAGALGGSASLTWSGTVLTSSGFAGPLNGTVGATTPAAGSFTTTTIGTSETLSYGTANGVTYLNGSKVVTSGSALTFDGTALTSLNNSSAQSIILSRTSAVARNWALGVDGDGGFRLTDATGSVVVLSVLPSGVAYLASESELAFRYNSSTEGMRLTSTGLGIGTSSPSFKLHVSVGSENTALFQNSSSSPALIRFRDTGTTTDPYVASYGNSMAFGVYGGSEFARFTSTGLGIGTSSPLLTASGRGNITINGSSNSILVLANGGATSGYVFGDASVLGFSAGSGANSRVMTFDTNGTERMRLDSAGNLGLGVTPTSSWLTSAKVMQLGISGVLFGRSASNQVQFGSNFYIDTGGTTRYINTEFASKYVQDSGQHQFYSVASGTAGNAITFTQAMTLDASGNLGIGVTSITGGYKAQINGNLLLGTAANPLLVGTTSLNLLGDNTSSSGMRIDSSGNVLVGTTTASGKLYVTDSTNPSPDQSVFFENSNAGFNKRILSLNASRNATSSEYQFLVCSISGIESKFIIQNSGNAQNRNNSYGAISDAKLKENIVDATPKLADLMQVKIRNFNFKTSPQEKQIGVVAQELETIFPSLIDESKDRDEEGNDLSTTTKAVKYSVFVPMLIKAIQEQQAIIESLKARLDAANL